ncbi:MAG TPA: ribose 5-phosphate isomerase B [Desulfobacteraceae bacterium]|nr:ribose 5-phosphate isomerase B [Desulfobacteraceae bacterium]
MVKLAVGSDHAGFELKKTCIDHLNGREGIEIEDIGVHGAESSDYPVVAHHAALGVAEGRYDRALLICGTGIGMSITANKQPGVRAALCHNLYTVKMARMHNDANILAFGSRVIGDGLAIEMVDLFLDTSFEGGRHKKRVDMIEPPRRL